MIFSTINAIVMFILALYWLSLPRTFGDEAFCIKWTCLVKKSLLGIDQKPDPNSVLYVDISGSKILLETQDPFYEEMTGFQHTSITNRADLAAFLGYVGLYGKDVPIVIMDIIFEEPSPQDSLFQSAIDRFPFPIVGAQRLLKNGKPSSKVIQIPTGIASYYSADAQFMKYPLYLQDSLPSLPLVALNIANHRQYDRGWLWPRIEGHPSLINPIIDFKIRPFDLNDGTTNKENTFPIRSLGTLLFEWEFWDKADISAMLEGKTIILGDFVHDKHQTVFGEHPGSLILHNAYLTLLEGESLIKPTWVLLLLVLFFGMFWRIFYQEKRGIQSKWHQRNKTATGKILADILDDVFFLVIITILSYFLFNIHINILVLLIYLKIVTFLLKRFFFKKKSPVVHE